MQVLKQSIFRVLNIHGTSTVGTGFVVTDHLAVTCAHVIQAAGSTCGSTVRIQFYQSSSSQIVQVLADGWSAATNDDIAFLQLDGLPIAVTPVIMGPAEHCREHHYATFGFAKLAGYDVRAVNDLIDETVSVSDQHKHPMLQLQGEEIDRGLSGSPVLDTQTDRVVGMVSEYKDSEWTRFAWATTAETLASALSPLDPTFRLWPDTFGPRELERYLAYLITSSQHLRLPDEHEVPLERLYISLRADEMNATEWKAEQALHQADVLLMQQTISAEDRHTERDLVRRAFARHSTAMKIATRDVPPLFAVREQGTRSLAEVVSRHPHVVILGDPGSGKSTLGKWLVLQHARAMVQRHVHVEVHADLVRPGEEAGDVLNLGECRLPILLRIAEYAQQRWSKEGGDSNLPLEAFLGYHEQKLDRPALLTSQVLQAIAWEFLAQGQALIILDGLDEVADLKKRLKIMHEVKRFLREPSSALDLSATHWSKNQVLLTSRLIGYQVEPLTDLPHYTVENMDHEAVSAFCQAWMMYIPSPPLDEASITTHRDALLTAVFNDAHPDIRALAGSPLLLTLLAHVYWNNPQHTLPTKRVALFEEATRLLYGLREIFWNRVGITAYSLRRALAQVAFHIQTQEPSGFTNQGQAEKAIRSVVREPEQVHAVLSSSGFLFEREQGFYTFVHRSLQEYFVALHLTDIDSLEEKHQNVQAMIDHLVGYSLDPSWREPVILAVGMISDGRHSEHRTLKVLLEALLAAPDPVTPVLPRRALLVAAAFADCERVPRGVGRQVAEQLLIWYADVERPGRSSIMRQRLQQAFRALWSGTEPVRTEAETVLSEAVKVADEVKRYVAIDLIIELEWDTPELASALVVAWKAYATPAGSMLVALDGMQRRHPECFRSTTLPLRQEQYAWIWERVQYSEIWQTIIRILYISLEKTCTSEQVNRDSPLTNLLLNFLRQGTDNTILQCVRQELVTLTTHTGTAEARDAALVLSVLGESSWIDAYRLSLQKQEQLLPLIASLAFFLRSILDHTFARHIIIPRYMERDIILDFFRDLAIIFDLTWESERESTFSYKHDISRYVERDSTLNIEINIEINIEKSIQQICLGWEEDAEIMLLLEQTLTSLHRLKQSKQGIIALEAVWNALLTAYQEQTPFQQVQDMETDTEHVTVETLPVLIENLRRLNDETRERAREMIHQERKASQVGISTIELMATLACSPTDQWRVNTQVAWALCHILHDEPVWLDTWIQQAEISGSSLGLLRTMHRMTTETLQVVRQRLPHTSLKVRKALLDSLSWLVRQNDLPRGTETSFAQELLMWLRKETDSKLRSAIICVLGHWQNQETITPIAKSLLSALSSCPDAYPQEKQTLTEALARLASRQIKIQNKVKRAFLVDGIQSVALPALVRLGVSNVVQSDEGFEDNVQIMMQNTGTSIVTHLASIIPNATTSLNAMLEAGTDDDVWNDKYHGILAVAVQKHLELHPDLVPVLLTRLEAALAAQDWPSRRITLAAVAACIEERPATIQEAAHGKLEALLVQGTTDAESFNSRRHALTALSYLRTVTPAIVPALLAGCQDIDIVQQDTIAAASRFQDVEGNVLSALEPWLTGESTKTAYAVTQVLSALGTSSAGTSPGRREHTIKLLVQGLQDAQRGRKVVIDGHKVGTLEDVMFTALLKIIDWIG